MKPSDWCFLSAVAAALIGMMAGIGMGITQDFGLAPAHAHLNLLGWVTMALFGLYYRGAVPRDRWLVRVQVGVSMAGFWSMPVGLAVYLGLGLSDFFFLVIVGSVLSLAGMVLFAVVVLRALTGQNERLGPARAGNA